MITQPIRQLLAVLLILSFKNSYAQSEVFKQPHKNEIGVHFGPLLMPFQDDGYYTPEFGATFKRIAKRSAFRFNFTYRPLSYDGGYVSIAPRIPVDSSYSIMRTTKTQRGFIGRVGYEYRIPCASAFYFVIGADITSKLVNKTREIRVESYVVDSVANQGTAEPDYTFSTLSTENTLKEESRTTSIGVELSGGVFFPVGKHFIVGGQLRNGFFYDMTKATTNDLVAETVTKSNSEDWFGDTDNFSSEVFLLYRF